MFCLNKDLFPHTKYSNGGHYVYIRKVLGNGDCCVSTITSLEDKNANYTRHKLIQVKYGNVYPIPKKDGNFTRWSGVTKDVLTVPLSKITQIGSRSFKKKHLFMIGKQ